MLSSLRALVSINFTIKVDRLSASTTPTSLPCFGRGFRGLSHETAYDAYGTPTYLLRQAIDGKQRRP